MPMPRVLPTYDEADAPAILLDGRDMVTDLPGAAAVAPWLFTPEGAAGLARIVNHLAKGMTYDVIDDPAAYAAEYRRARAAEDPDAPVNIHGYQLSKFAMPDLDRIAAPTYADGRIVFYAADGTIGVPYRVEARVTPAGMSDVTYTSLPAAA
jgi:hypothetical protein